MSQNPTRNDCDRIQPLSALPGPAQLLVDPSLLTERLLVELARMKKKTLVVEQQLSQVLSPTRLELDVLLTVVLLITALEVIGAKLGAQAHGTQAR